MFRRVFAVMTVFGLMLLPGPVSLDLDSQAEAAPRKRVTAAGKYSVSGRRVTCGRVPTLVSRKFFDYGGAMPGLIIMNPRKLRRLPRQVRLFVYAHECGHQFIGRDEDAADCYGAKMARRRGWLNRRGLRQICKWLRPQAGDGVHSPGWRRCRNIRRCYRQAAPRRRVRR